MPSLQKETSPGTNWQEAEHTSQLVRAMANDVAACIQRGEILSIGSGASYWFNRVAFSDDGRHALVTGGALIIMDLLEAKEVGRAMELQYARLGLAITRDGKQYATGHQGDVNVRIGEVKSILGVFSYTNRDPGNIRNQVTAGGGALILVSVLVQKKWPAFAKTFARDAHPRKQFTGSRLLYGGIVLASLVALSFAPARAREWRRKEFESLKRIGRQQAEARRAMRDAQQPAREIVPTPRETPPRRQP